MGRSQHWIRAAMAEVLRIHTILSQSLTCIGVSLFFLEKRPGILAAGKGIWLQPSRYNVQLQSANTSQIITWCKD
eukprot:5498797-Amphidinium_carterae.1